MTDVLAVAEHRRGELRDVSLELVTAGLDLLGNDGGALNVAVIGGDVDAFATALDLEGVDVVHTVDVGEEFNHDVYTQVVRQLYDEVEPRMLLLPHSVDGMDYAPAVAEALDLPLVTDVIAISADDGLAVTREQYGGKVETTFEIDADHAVVTIRPREWAQADSAGNAQVESFAPELDDASVNTTVAEYETVGVGDVDISDASFVVAVGRGIQEEENLALVEELMATSGATLAASRPVVDSDWLPKSRQVGQSGKVVTPEVYIAIGISGAVQHIAGMKGSDTIIAINTDADAPIFDIADYGIVGDLFEVVPELVEQLDGEAPNV